MEGKGTPRYEDVPSHQLLPGYEPAMHDTVIRIMKTEYTG